MGGRIFYQLEQNYTIKQPNTYYSEETNINIETLHGGMIAFLALLAALLIPIAVMIFDKAFNEKFKIHPQKNTFVNENLDAFDLDDFFPWEKDALLRKVAKIPFLLLAFVLAAISLIFIGINSKPIQITAIILYIISCIFILSRFICLTRWLFAQSKITTQETYRQKVKFKYLHKLRRDIDLVNTWVVTWNNISPTNPHQLSYLKIFLATAPEIPDEIFAWPYMDTFLQNIKEDNPRINVTKSDIQEALLNYSLDSLSQKNSDKTDIKLNKNRIIETLLEIQLKKDPSTLGITFFKTDNYISSNNDYSILKNFIHLLLRKIDNDDLKITNDDILKIFLQYFPHQWDITNLLSKKEQPENNSKELICLKTFLNWLAGVDSKHKDSVTQALLKAEANSKIFSELLLFYKIYNDNEEESVKYFIKELKDISIYPTKSDNTSDENAVKILSQAIPFLKKTEHINTIKKALKKVEKEIKTNDEKERLENLKYYFELAKNLQANQKKSKRIYDQL